MRAVWRLLGLLRRSVTLLVVVALLATNVLAFTSTAFVGAVSAVAARAGLTTVAARKATELTSLRAANTALRTRLDGLGAKRKQIVRRIRDRTLRTASRSAGGVITQSLPWIGIASVVGLTAWELNDACETMKDLEDLEPSDDGAKTTQVCGVPVPTVEDVRASLPAPSWDFQRWTTVEGLSDAFTFGGPPTPHASIEGHAE